MTVTYGTQPESQVLAEIVAPRVLQDIENIVERFWHPPHVLTNMIERLILEKVGGKISKLVVSGERKNVSIYAVDDTETLVIMPFESFNKNPVLQDAFGNVNSYTGQRFICIPTTPVLLERLRLPKILLVNPCVLENFPVPRLSLSIGVLASYLRRRQKGDVRIIDMQVGTDITEVVEQVGFLRPDIFGLSVSYGQKNVAINILDRIYSLKNYGAAPLVVLGNIVPASFPEEFLQLYPDLIVAYGEGELSLEGLVDYVTHKVDLEDVPGIAYRSKQGLLMRTLFTAPLMEEIPIPSLDTIPDIARCKGALTLELSRGCQWNVCTFCPREHKSTRWKTYSAEQMVDQFHALATVADEFEMSKHIFLADEEFVGGMEDGGETKRIASFATQLIERRVNMRFDAAARVDQVYNPKMDKKWHIDRLEMWHLCRKAGLDRLFMGIESGSDTQLQRYGKGIKAEDSVVAIRLLSALNIPLRFGFITFDQLMTGLDELKQNIAFLEREDAFMRPINPETYGYDRLFELLSKDKDFVAENAAQKPIYTGVSYMLASMEVLINSRYRVKLKHAERHGKTLIIDDGSPDTNMGRYKVRFLDDLIGDFSVFCQKWIDRHFGLAYCIKSLFKTASDSERKHLMSWMIVYRQISLALAKALVYIFDECEDEAATQLSSLRQLIGMPGVVLQIADLRRSDRCLDRIERLEVCMNALDTVVEVQNNVLWKQLKEGEITDTQDHRLATSLLRWRETRGQWILINDPSR